MSIKLAIFNEGKINVLIDKEAVKRRQVNFERRQRIDKRIIIKKKRNDTGNRLGQPDGSGRYRIPYKYPATDTHTVSSFSI